MRDASAEYVTTVATFMNSVGILCHEQVRTRVLRCAFDSGIQRRQVESGIEWGDGRNKSGNIASPMDTQTPAVAILNPHPLAHVMNNDDTLTTDSGIW